MTKESRPLYAFISHPQNAKKEGMGKSLIESTNSHFRSTIDRISDLTGSNCLDPNLGYSPVVFAIAVHDALVQATGLRPNIVAGLSVGENASLVQGGAVKLDLMMQILRERERLTGKGRIEAVKRGMVAIRGVSLEEDGQQNLKYFLAQEPHLNGLHIANITGPFDGVLSGEAEDFDAAIRLLKGLSKGVHAHEGGKVSVTRLDMSDAFHSKLMMRQQLALVKELSRLNVKDRIHMPEPGVVYSPTLKRWLNTKKDVYLAIAKQLTRPVDVRTICKEIGRCRFIITSDPLDITPRILKANGVTNVLNISDAKSFESAVKELRAAV